MARVEILSGRSSGTVVELGFDDGRWQVGTARTADVRLRERGVSYAHATICADDGCFTLIDQSSASGTFVNGKRLETGERGFPLASGDAIRFGSVEVRFLVQKRSASQRIDALAAMTQELTRTDDLRDQLAEAEQELSRAIEESAALRRELDLHEESNELEDARTETARLTAALERALVERDAARGEAKHYDEQIGRLRAKLELALSGPEEADTLIAALGAAKDQLEEQLSETQGELAALQETCSTRDARVSELESGVTALEERLGAELADARRDAEELRSQVDEINTEMIELQDELEKAQGSRS